MELWEGVGSGIPFMNFSFFLQCFGCLMLQGKERTHDQKWQKHRFHQNHSFFLVALPRRARKHNQKPKNRVSKRIISGKKRAKVGDACIGEKTMTTTFVKLLIRDLLYF